MAVGVIDLGTNTFNLLIGDINDGKLNVIFTKKHPVLFGMGGIMDGTITEDAYIRGIQALRDFHNICQSYQVSEIRAFATSAMRDADNSKEFIRQVHQDFGFRIEVISGMKEANFIYLGVGQTMGINGRALIMDIGGGSTELITCNDSTAMSTLSLDIGVSRLYQEFNRPGQFDPAHKERIEQVLAQDCLQILDGQNISTLIGSSGSFESFYEMVERMPFPKTSEAHQLDFNRLNSVLDWTISSTLEERLDNDWIIPLRKDMLPIAAIMVKWVINNSTINEIWISPYSLKEGALMEE